MLKFSFSVGSFLQTIGLQRESPTTPISKDISVKVYPYFYRYSVVEWDIPSEWGGCLFDIYRSGADDTWIKITDAPTSGNYYIDREVIESSKFTRNFYIVEVRLPSGQRCRSNSTTFENKRSSWVELRAKEISRRETLLLQKFTGVDSVIFRRRKFGRRCSKCWNPETNQVMMDSCTTCYGTSFEEGYYPGFPCKIQYEPTPNNVSPGVTGIQEPNSIPAWTTSKPEIEAWDLVMRVPDKKMYRVDSIQSTELQTVPLRQIMQITEIGKDSIEFSLADTIGPSSYLKL